MYIADHNVQSHLTDKEGPARRAFTLIEIIVVVVILAIAALIAIPVFSGASEMQLRAAADKLAADIEYAKSMAVTTQKYYRVVFDTDAEAYEIQVYNTGTNTWTVITDPVKKANFRVTYPNESRLSSVGIQSVTLGGSILQFDYTGAPSEGAGNPPGAALAAAKTVTLEAKDQTTIVTVEPVTGFITIQ